MLCWCFGAIWAQMNSKWCMRWTFLWILTLKYERWWFVWQKWCMNLLLLHKGALEVMCDENSRPLYHFVNLVTYTRVSGQLANFNMQWYFCILHAQMSSLMYVACEMSMYLLCKMHFWWSWTLCAILTFGWWNQRGFVNDMHKDDGYDVHDMFVKSNFFFCEVVTDTRVSGHLSICMIWPYHCVAHIVLYFWWSFCVSWLVMQCVLCVSVCVHSFHHCMCCG